MTDAFTIDSPALPQSAVLAGFHGTEGLSQLYRFDLLLVIPGDEGHELDMKAVIGAAATLRSGRTNDAPVVLAGGIVAAFELVNAVEERSVFRAVLVPKVWHLAQSLHSRVFTNQSVPAILESVLDSRGFSRRDDYRLELTGKFPDREFVCQYKESDFAFMSRWMEREGLYYFFERAGAVERLIITDHRAAHNALSPKPVRYFSQAEGTSTADALRAFTCRCASMPGSLHLKDYDYDHPTLNVEGQARLAPHGVGEIHIYGAGFQTPEEGERLARIKAQSLLADEVVYRGSGATLNLRPGYTFDLEDHPRSTFNTTYLTTALEHWGNQAPGVPELRSLIPWDDTYRIEVTAITSDVQYRAPQRTAWPRIYGTEQAVVDGPATSEYAQIDGDGRYEVKFFFDESALTGGKASGWVRMLQPHGGNPEGFHFPLRVGTEVACTFAGGDPDRPAISGVAPNALNPSPVTASNHCLNVVQTGGRNRIELDDTDGQQLITISTPHNNSYIQLGAAPAGHALVDNTEGNKMSNVLGNSLSMVEGASTSTVLGLSTSAVLGGYIKLTFPLSLDALVGWRRTYTLGSVYTRVKGNTTSLVVGNTTSTVKGDPTSTVVGNPYSRVSGSPTSAVIGNPTSRVYGNVTSKVAGDSTTTITGHYRTKLNNRTETIDGFKFERIKGYAYKFADQEVETKDTWSVKAVNYKTLSEVADNLSNLNLVDADLTIFSQ